MVKGPCAKCHKNKKDITSSGKSKGLCHVCYKKFIWKPKKIQCKRCKRLKPMHAKGLCAGCYNSVFHVERVKLHNAKRYHNIDFETYKNITEKCVICGFDKIVDLHHLDMNHKNNSSDNLIGLCPNHHKMVHHRKHQKELFEKLNELGYKATKKYEDDKFFKEINS